MLAAAWARNAAIRRMSRVAVARDCGQASTSSSGHPAWPSASDAVGRGAATDRAASWRWRPVRGVGLAHSRAIIGWIRQVFPAARLAGSPIQGAMPGPDRRVVPGAPRQVEVEPERAILAVWPVTGQRQLARDPWRHPCIRIVILVEGWLRSTYSAPGRQWLGAKSRSIGDFVLRGS